MIPSFLEKYRSEIEQQKLGSIKISAKPLEGPETLPITQSKFLGRPYIPGGKPYPHGADGTPMILLAQINFAEVPALENYPTNGILQLFVHPTDWFDMSDYKILYHENDNEMHQTDFDFLTDELYKDSPIYCEHALEFKKETEYGGESDFRFEMNFDGMDYFDYQDTLPEEQQKQFDDFFDTAGHKLGGYAFFTQTDPREDKENAKDDVLLLQIDTDDKIMFGDSGVANVFININDLKNKNFDKAYFNWDCC